jgi:hypothetical protein
MRGREIQITPPLKGRDEGNAANRYFRTITIGSWVSFCRK